MRGLRKKPIYCVFILPLDSQQGAHHYYSGSWFVGFSLSSLSGPIGHTKIKGGGQLLALGKEIFNALCLGRKEEEEKEKGEKNFPSLSQFGR